MKSSIICVSLSVLLMTALPLLSQDNGSGDMNAQAMMMQEQMKEDRFQISGFMALTWVDYDFETGKATRS